MSTSVRSTPPLTRCSSHDLIRTHPTQNSASPTPPRSNSFVASRRCGIVSEQDALRLAAASVFDNRRQSPRTTTAQTVANAWPAPVLRQRSSDNPQPRPLSTGYLPSKVVETQSQQRIQIVKVDGVDTQNVALLPNRQLIQQPADGRWRQWNSTPQRKGRPFGDVTPPTTPDKGWVVTTRSADANHYDAAVQNHQQQVLLAEREAELRAIRSTMEKNEAAILRAMDDQRRAWDAEVTAERESWENRLREAERQIEDVRQTLTERIRNLERENSALQLSSMERTHNRRGHGGVHGRSVHSNDGLMISHGDDEEFDNFKQLPMINGVDATVASVSKTSTGRTANCRSSSEQRQRQRPPTTELNGAHSDAAVASRLPMIPERPLSRCQQCEITSRQLEQVRQEFDAERQQWLAEKRRVITYQKLLQSKYVELERRCAELQGSAATDNLKHLNETVGSYVNGHAGWQLEQTQSSSRLIPFGHSIET